jgi:hypothetical protein
MSDSTLSVRYRKFRYQAQSDIADHGCRTKCPPMGVCIVKRPKEGVILAGAILGKVLERRKENEQNVNKKKLHVNDEKSFENKVRNWKNKGKKGA